MTHTVDYTIILEEMFGHDVPLARKEPLSYNLA
jgi:hypothetical protein